MKTKIYLDTSIPSAYFGFNKPMRQHITQKWFENEIENYSINISTLTIQEIEKLKNIEKRENILRILLESKPTLLEITEDTKKLANEYINNGAIPKSEYEDALHIAIASINHIESLASWNFKHIVSINPIRKIHEINKKQNLRQIEIGSLELFGGYKYGNL